MKKFSVFKVIKIMLFVALAVVVFGYVSMRLWNWLVPDLFHGPIITFGQAIGLIILGKILFGGFHRGGHCGRGGWHNRKQYWKEKMEARMANMTPEEKEKFRDQMRARCGGRWGGFDGDEDKSASETKS